MRTNVSLFDEERTMVTMSFGDHIEELRRRLIRALLGLFAGMILTLIPPLNLGRLIVHQLQEPAQRTLVAFHAEQASKRAADAGRAASFTPMPARVHASICSCHPSSFPGPACSSRRLSGGPVCRASSRVERFRAHDGPFGPWRAP